jgi:hypothetical protein
MISSKYYSMTENFDRFIRKILAESFAELPDECPYGFWVSPSGIVRPVRWQQHGSDAIRIIKSIVNYTTDFYEKNISDKTDHSSEMILAIGYLLNRGWIKINKDVTQYTPQLKYTASQSLTDKQKNALGDLEMLYDISVVPEKFSRDANYDQLFAAIGAEFDNPAKPQRKPKKKKNIKEDISVASVLGNDGLYDTSDARVPYIIGKRRRKRKKRS